MKNIRLSPTDKTFRAMNISKAKMEANLDKSLTWDDYFKLIFEDYHGSK